MILQITMFNSRGLRILIQLSFNKKLFTGAQYISEYITFLLFVYLCCGLNSDIADTNMHCRY